MAHWEHAKSTQLLRGVENDRRESTWHLGVEANLNSCLDLVLTLHQQVQELLGVYHSLSKVCHKANKSCVPLIHNLKTVRSKLSISHCRERVCGWESLDTISYILSSSQERVELNVIREVCINQNHYEIYLTPIGKAMSEWQVLARMWRKYSYHILLVGIWNTTATLKQPGSSQKVKQSNCMTQ